MTRSRFFRRCVTPVFVAAMGLYGNLANAAPSVVVSINPLHSLVSALMDTVAAPVLLMPAATSPHGWAMRPSQARAIHQADLVVWVGPQLEQSLARALSASGNNERHLSLIRLEGMTLLERRDTHDHDDHAGHGHDAGHDDHHPIDPHLWLDPENAMHIVTVLASRLAQIDPPNGATYAANAKKLLGSLQHLAGEVRTGLDAVRGRQLVVYHDAFQYLERFAGLKRAIVLTEEPEQPRSLAQVSRLEAKLDGQNLRCLFTEPQFDGRMARILAGRHGLAVRVIDPLGKQSGKDGYQALMRALVDSISRCAAPEG